MSDHEHIVHASEEHAAEGLPAQVTITSSGGRGSRRRESSPHSAKFVTATAVPESPRIRLADPPATAPPTLTTRRVTSGTPR